MTVLRGYRIALRLIVLGSVFSLGVPPAGAQKKGSPSSADEKSLKAFLQGSVEDRNTRFTVGLRDLNGDGIPEAIVYLTGSGNCGSGGCDTLILARNGNSWKIVSTISITRLPIRVLANTLNGWRNLGVRVQGGGIQPGYEAELRFDGKTYPENPSVPPARPTKKRLTGEVVIASTDKALPLFGR